MELKLFSSKKTQQLMMELDGSEKGGKSRWKFKVRLFA
jgi:hypothetical protein